MDNKEPQINTGEATTEATPREPQQSDFQPGMQGEATTPPQPPAPQSEPADPTPQAGGEKKSVGAVFGIVIVIILVVLAGFYFWGSQLNKEAGDDQAIEGSEMTAEQISAAPDPTLQRLNAQSASDEVVDIEADLNSTELNSLDQEISDIDLEFTF